MKLICPNCGEISARDVNYRLRIAFAKTWYERHCKNCGKECHYTKIGSTLK